MSLHSTDPNDPNRPLSIDLAFELERQLDNDSVHDRPLHSSERPQSLDPHVLASIIMQLRHSLSDVSRERDRLLRRLSEAQSQEAHLTETIQQLGTERTRAQDELEIAKRKIVDDESAIAMLRAKVEESRRGVMRLQTENRRMSQVSLATDLSRAGLPIIGGPLSNKRASFTPITGSGTSVPMGHRRMSSFSDSGFGHNHAYKDNVITSLPPLDRSSPRHSGLFRISPSKLDLPPESVSGELESIRSELKSVKDELEDTRRELCDAKEAKEASETCVKALREFIEENNVGVHRELDSTKSPVSATGDDVESKKNGMGWTFKLWKAEPPAKPVTNSAHNSVLSSFPASSVPVAAPISRKFGSFFGSRTYMASNTSASSAPSVASGQEIMYPGSDHSSVDDSVAEPISPAGGEGAATDVIVRHGVLSSPDLYGDPELMHNKHDPPVEEIDLS